ncbi:MAG: glycosyltransferase [Bacteroidia bacterium]|nr:glycosyltransferase [Bacteroidia bacterium]
MDKQTLTDYFESAAPKRLKWVSRNRYYHTLIERYYAFMIPPGKRVMEIGCGPGDLLSAVKPAYGVGLDISPTMVEIARKRHPELHFRVMDAESIEPGETFDYIILSDLVGVLWDVMETFEGISGLCHARTRIIISFTSYLWEPVFKAGEFLRIKQRQPVQNWLSSIDITNLLNLAGFEVIKKEKKILLPKWLPLITWFFNRIVANLPLINYLDMVRIITARPVRQGVQEYSVSVIVPARNERGNIEAAIKRIPPFGSAHEVIFVEGHSSDSTYKEMLRVQKAYPDHDIKVIKQSGKGKGNAVREGFDLATGDILMILDADLTMPPEDLPKFYQTLRTNSGEFINGCRLVYPLEKQAMRALNLIANKFFGLFFTYLLGQQLKDTLCGTKVLFSSDYEVIKQNRHYFGDFDPFGDFDLLFGASKANLKITEVPIRYRERTYGSTQISRFRHGLLLFRMSFYAARKMKFI